MDVKELLKRELESPITQARGGIYLNIETIKQIKIILEAWEVVQRHCDYHEGDRFNCIPGGFYLIKPIKGKDFLIVKKALEVNND